MSASKTFFFFHFLTETIHLSALDRGKKYDAAGSGVSAKKPTLQK